jgi:hypothetical protein
MLLPVGSKLQFGFFTAIEAQRCKEKRDKVTKVQRHKAEKPIRYVPMSLCAFVPVVIRPLSLLGWLQPTVDDSGFEETA